MALEEAKKSRILDRFEVDLSNIPAFGGFLLLTFSIVFDIYYSMVIFNHITVIPVITGTERFLIAVFPKISYFIVGASLLVLLSCILLGIDSRNMKKRKENFSRLGIVLLGLFALFPILPDIIFFIYPASNVFANYYHAMNVARYYPGILATYFLATAFTGTVLMLRHGANKARLIIAYIGMGLILIVALYNWFFEPSMILGPYLSILNSKFAVNTSLNFLYFIEATEHHIPFHSQPALSISVILLIASLLISAVYFPVKKKRESA